MQTALSLSAQAASVPKIVVTPSLAIDLSWVLHAAESPELQERHPVLAALFEEHPELSERVRTFWDDDACFTDLQVLAHRVDALSVVEPDQLFELLASACTMPPHELTLASETEAEKAAVMRRLNRLRRSSRVRQEYLTLLADLWTPIARFWGREGLAAAESAGIGYRQQLAQGTQWHELITGKCEMVTAILPELIERHKGGGDVTIVPCYFFGKGLLIELPELVLVGVPAVRSDLASRVRTEVLARRLKTLADPTRLAILDYLATGPQAVGEIARAFGLAQPTVSIHVKHLREAGMVNASRTGTRVELAVDQAAVVGLLDELRTVVA